ncbi:MAG: hypothetical protein R2865_12400 [Deinococcales bacterium]
MNSKSAWRNWAKEKRAQLDSQQLSEALVSQLLNSSLLSKHQHILLYMAFGDEISLERLQQNVSENAS